MNGTGEVECEVMGLPGRRKTVTLPLHDPYKVMGLPGRRKTGGRPCVPRAPISR